MWVHPDPREAIHNIEQLCDFFETFANIRKKRNALTGLDYNKALKWAIGKEFTTLYQKLSNDANVISWDVTTTGTNPRELYALSDLVVKKWPFELERHTPDKVLASQRAHAINNEEGLHGMVRTDYTVKTHAVGMLNTCRVFVMEFTIPRILHACGCRLPSPMPMSLTDGIELTITAILLIERIHAKNTTQGHVLHAGIGAEFMRVRDNWRADERSVRELLRHAYMLLAPNASSDHEQIPGSVSNHMELSILQDIMEILWGPSKVQYTVSPTTSPRCRVDVMTLVLTNYWHPVNAEAVDKDLQSYLNNLIDTIVCRVLPHFAGCLISRYIVAERARKNIGRACNLAPFCAQYN